ncbi:hypothetical protein [Pantanalinema sp. GBBB05]|uniref:hypothetical protein n=1 Tax=Pantanalinema sp. GBBB05 TaxID=2604139 RepID=UPI001D8DC1B1|nr:hypothetical protein [Pantanalinema sp. GBBB05]
MMTLPMLLRSLLLASMLSFAVPLLVLGVLIFCLSLFTWLPVSEAVAQIGLEQLLKFLAVFGQGDAFQGVIIIGSTCSLVGTLFDSYAYYQRQSLKDS